MKYYRLLSMLLFLCIVVTLVPLIPTPVAAASNPYPQYNYYNSASDYQIACTWYAWNQVYNRLGIALPAWGNGGQWLDNAKNAGYSTGTIPKANSLAVYNGYDAWGHVEFVTAVNGNNITVNSGGYNPTTPPGTIDGLVKYGVEVGKNNLRGFIYLTPSTYTLDVNGYLDNDSNAASLGSYGTFDVYINGSRVANDVNDYCTAHPAGTSYEIKDIRPKSGKAYRGYASGSDTIRGTLDANRNVRLSFFTVDAPGWTTNNKPSAISIFKGHTYYFYSKEATWYGAKIVAEYLGGHLATISNGSENTFVYELAGKKTAWIGATDANSEGNWKWVNGESFSYHPWNTGEPNNSVGNPEGSENYAHITDGGGWNDAAGCTLKPFVVEFDQAYTVKYVLNNSYASGAPAAQTKAHGLALSLSASEPSLPCHTFVGWTKTWGSNTVDYLPGDSYNQNANLTLYPVWVEGISSAWTTTKPAGVPESHIESKVQYRYSDKETKVSETPNLAGYTLVSSSWKETGSGSIEYVKSWHSGFSTSNSLYSQYNKIPKTAGETDTKKIKVSESHIGYIYWHWCQNSYEYGPVNRYVSDYWQERYPGFHAFSTSDNAGHTDPNGAYDPNVFYYHNAGCCRDTYWWWQTPIYRQSYTEYTKQFTYERWSDWSDWSDTAYTSSNSRRVETRTVYRALNADNNPHTWAPRALQAVSGAEHPHKYSCLRCGKAIETKVCAAQVFADMPPKGSWSHDPIDWAWIHGITSGISETRFQPNGTCTRGQVVTFLWRAMGEPEPKSTAHPFVDAEEGRFYYIPMLWAYENGVTNGTDNTHFSPNANCTRAQVVTFLWNAMGKPEPSITEHPFVDAGENRFYYKAMLWAYENGVTNGTSATTFSPNAVCTRAQVVTFLYNLLGK